MGHTSRFSNYLVILALISAAFPWSGCSRQTSADAFVAPPTTASSDPNVYVVDHPEQFPLCPVEARKIPARLEANGTISPDVSLTVHVTSLAGGRVVETRARLGDEVREGQVLVVIRSQDLAQAISDYQKSKADELLARKALERAQDLYAHGATPQKELQQAEDEAQKARVDLDTGIERIRALGGDVNSPSPIIEVKSPISGTVVEQNVAGGEGVKSLDNSPNLFTVADLSRVWLLCDVYENNLAQVKLGDSAEVRINAFPDQLWTGKVSNISRILDPSTRTAKVRIVLDNRGGLLRPNMFAVATFVSKTSAAHMVVPETALLRLHDKDWVFRSEGGKKYRRVEVQAGPPSPGGFQLVLAGLGPGDRVVANALQFMNGIEQR